MTSLLINIPDYDSLFIKRKCPDAPRHQDNHNHNSYNFYNYNIPNIKVYSNYVKNYKKCPSPPKSSRFLNHDFPTDSYSKEIDDMYKKVENSYAIQGDINNTYFVEGTRVLVGKKFYKIFSNENHKVINMKKIYLLVKKGEKWIRSDIVLERSKDESDEWDITFD